MRKARIYAATVNGQTVLLKAYLAINAIAEFQKMDNTIRPKDVHLLRNARGLHQIPVEDR